MSEPTTEQILSEFNASATPEPSQAEPSASTETSSQPSVTEYEYTANGKTIKEPLETILKRASQGYNYAQHMQSLNQKMAEVDQKHKTALELEQKYGEIDKFAQANPEWNDHLRNSWEARFNINKTSDEGLSQQAALPPHLQQEINELKSFVDSVKAERADQAYQSSFNRVRESYPDVDFTQTDPDTGRSLEQQVLEFARDNGINKFEPAFKAFYADKLIERARVQAREQVAADLKQRSKAGLLGTSQAPARASGEQSYPQNYNNMTMEQIHNWVVQNYT